MPEGPFEEHRLASLGYNPETVYAFDNSPLPGQVLKDIDFDANYEGGVVRRQAVWISGSPPNCISSQVARGGNSLKFEAAQDKHKVVIDVDLPVKVVPSSTPGHFHLFIDHEMNWNEYKYFLYGCMMAGIIEPGYYRAAMARQTTEVRLPWIKKGEQGTQYLD